MPFDPKSLLKMHDLRDLPRSQIHLVMAIRICAIASQNGEDPIELLAVKFGSVTAAQSLVSLSESIARAWPVPFTISRPCCAMLTPDEKLIAELMGAVLRRDSDRFTSDLGEMVPVDQHQRLYRDIAHFAAALEQAVVMRANG